MKESFNDPILDIAVENQLRWNYNTFFRECRIEPKIDTFQVYGLNIEFDYVYLNAEKSNLLDLKDEEALDKTIGEYYLLEALRHIGVDKDFWDPDTILYQDVFAASTKERIRPTSDRRVVSSTLGKPAPSKIKQLEIHHSRFDSRSGTKR